MVWVLLECWSADGDSSGGVRDEEVRCTLVTTCVASGGCVVLSYEKKRSPPSILEVFLIGLGGVLGSW